MTWERVLSIALTVALYNLFRVYRERFRMWKDARTEIPAYRDWRGRYVPDLHFIRLKRAIIAAWVVFILVGFPLGYMLLTNFTPSTAAR